MLLDFNERPNKLHSLHRQLRRLESLFKVLANRLRQRRALVTLFFMALRGCREVPWTITQLTFGLLVGVYTRARASTRATRDNK